MLQSRYNEVAEIISHSDYESLKNELQKWYSEFFQDREFQTYDSLLTFHIRKFVPNGWVSGIENFDFPDIKCNQFVWIFFGGDIHSCDLKWYKIAAIESFQKMYKETEDWFMLRSINSLCEYFQGSLNWLVLQKLERERIYKLAGNSTYQKVV